MKKNLILILFSTFVLMTMSIYQAIKSSDNRLHIVFCDVGQGDGIYIRTPDKKDIVVDAGANEKMLECLSRHMPFWDRTIDIVFSTHADLDHYGGLSGIFEAYKIIYYAKSSNTSPAQSYEYLEELVKKEGSVNKIIYKGDKFVFSSSVEILTLWPTKEFEKNVGADDNNLSLVQIVKFGNFELLLDGDLDKEILNTIIDTQKDIDVLKLSHHGSYTGTDNETFSHIKPELSIISSGKNNRYGHPHKEVLDVLKQNNLKYLRTDEKGDIEIVTDGTKFWVN